MIVGVVADVSLAHAVVRMQEAAPFCDRFEVRLDLLRGLDPEANWAPLFAHAPRPVIATCRGPAEGGGFHGGPEEQRDWLQQAIAAGAQAVDLELLAEIDLQRDPAQVTLIRSVHQFEGEPPALGTLLALARHAADSGADVFKVAFPARGISDCLRVRELCEQAPLPCVAVALGELGVPSRIAYRALGSEWTYGPLPGAAPLAPGQVPVEQLRTRYQAHSLHPDTRFFGVLGNPVAHSRGVRVHNGAFALMPELEACYLPLLSEDVTEFWEFARKLPLSGFSVTAPHKQAVRAGLDRVTPAARVIGAVNTVWRDEHGRYHGDNTDYAGAFEPLEERLPGGVHAFAGMRGLVLGAGGAARTVVAGLLARGAEVYVYNRTHARAEALVADMRAHAATGALAELVPPGLRHDGSAEILSSNVFALQQIDHGFSGLPFDILINATSAGMHPHEEETPFDLLHAVEQGFPLSDGAWVYDLVYVPAPTRFLKQAHQLGRNILDGRPMYRRQAELQFELWHNQELPSEETLDAAESKL